MLRERDDAMLMSGLPASIRKVRERTPARLLQGRTGAAYRTETQLELRRAHAAAKDAVRGEMALARIFDEAFIERWQLFEVTTTASTKSEFLQNPDLGRHFSESAGKVIRESCPSECDIQIAIGDGLSVPAVAAQAPSLLPELFDGAKTLGYRVGRTFVIRHCRVGVINDIGETLKSRVVVLLIGERPGLATAESLSAYMAYRPNKQHTDADRNLISNIHARGVSISQAAARILNLAAQMIRARTSGVQIKESFAPLGRSEPPQLRD